MSFLTISVASGEIDVNLIIRECKELLPHVLLKYGNCK
jgi:hypothetical protein